jgi:hypothetical protein
MGQYEYLTRSPLLRSHRTARRALTIYINLGYVAGLDAGVLADTHRNETVIVVTYLKTRRRDYAASGYGSVVARLAATTQSAD